MAGNLPMTIATKIHCVAQDVACNTQMANSLFKCLGTESVQCDRIDSFDSLEIRIRAASRTRSTARIILADLEPLVVVYRAYGTHVGVGWCFEDRHLVEVHLFMVGTNPAHEADAVQDLEKFFGAITAPDARPAWVALRLDTPDACVRSGLAGFFLSAAHCNLADPHS
jgi:hypothetical protein